MENSIRLIKQVERTHGGSGIPILFSNLCVLGQISPMIIGEKSVGKGVIINSTKTLGTTKELDINMDSVTYTDLANRINKKVGVNMIWRITEWSTLSDYHRKLFVTVGSQIITDHNFYHSLGMQKGKMIEIDIKNCNLVCIIGIQPLKMQRMMVENENWESLASDRFVKFCMFNPLRKDTIETLPKYEVDNTLHYIDNVPIDTDMKYILKMLKNQISEDRLITMCRHLLRSYAVFEGKLRIGIKEELEFVKLFWPYLKIYPSLVYSLDIEEETSFAVGSMRLLQTISRHEGISINELFDSFHIYEKAYIKRKYAIGIQEPQDYKEMIRRHSQILVDKGIIQVVQNSPIRYYMSDSFQKYFEWYRSISK